MVITYIQSIILICNAPALLKYEEQFGDSSAKIDVLMEQIENKSSQLTNLIIVLLQICYLKKL